MLGAAGWELLQLNSRCSRDSQCQTGLYCFACPAAGSAFPASYCTRSDATPTSAFPKVMI